MKRIGGLFERIPLRETLAHAAWAAAAGKRDRAEVRAFFAGWENEALKLSGDLRAGRYRFGPYRAFPVHDTKTRTIHAPSFRDRVVHHAIIAVCGPVFEKGALLHSHACRRGHGQHVALRQARHWTRRAGWYGKIDVVKFYDRIEHGVLRRLLARRFRETRLLALFDRLLDSYGTIPGHGLPIGALTSQYLGNFLLDEFDRAIKSTGMAHRYLRYMDDIVIWGDRATLGRLRPVARDALARLGLEMKHGGEWNRCGQGVPFLGFVVYPDRLRLGRQGRQRLRRNLRGLEEAWREGTISESERQARATSLFAHARCGNDLAWRRMAIERSGADNEDADDFAFGEALEPQPRQSRRLLEQHRQELPLGDPQQEEARQPQQEPGLPCLSGSRHGGSVPPDDAPSRATPASGAAEATDKPPASPDIPPQARAEKGPAGAPSL